MTILNPAKEHATVQPSPYAQGYAAHIAGRDIVANPHSKYSAADAMAEWRMGWLAAAVMFNRGI